jgi:hypothetical protein
MEVPNSLSEWKIYVWEDGMKAAELICVNCKNWKSEKCGDCFMYFCERGSVNREGAVLEDYKHTFITPEEYEKRTGKKWGGLVWVFYNVAIADTGDYEQRLRPECWESVRNDMHFNPNKYVDYPFPVCVLGDSIPDDAWEGEIFCNRENMFFDEWGDNCCGPRSAGGRTSMNGIDIICTRCRFSETHECLKWGYWKNVNAEYAKICGTYEDKVLVDDVEEHDDH